MRVFEPMCTIITLSTMWFSKERKCRRFYIGYSHMATERTHAWSSAPASAQKCTGVAWDALTAAYWLVTYASPFAAHVFGVQTLLEWRVYSTLP